MKYKYYAIDGTHLCISAKPNQCGCVTGRKSIVMIEGEVQASISQCKVVGIVILNVL